MKIAKEIKTNATYNVHLPSSVNALYQLASSLSNADDSTKEEIFVTASIAT
ncbi:hypothetical protein [Cyanobacterium sp. Dongsha4]|uniref:hypothetical protein n=1 Tax=Cyanobacterium sp. DS4 TaxID=2878255 RepID=UPI002E8098D1|nr:hypothetical protein [Cyanobacterium sp. Dongsha4]WVL02518.1 hypothetical protein Dongsha4_18660 [Cyanobacterium sp. Dongsha4]